MKGRLSSRAPAALAVLTLAVLAVLVAGLAWLARFPADRAAADASLVAVFATDEGPVTTDPLPLADTEPERRTGLSGRTSLAPDAGMIFRFAEPTTAAFWMKDTLVPLSIAFIDADHRIVSILDMDPCTADPCPTFGPEVEYVTAVEMNQGWFRKHGVGVSDTVTWNSDNPRGNQAIPRG